MVEASPKVVLPALKSNNLAFEIFKFGEQPRTQLILRALSKKAKEINLNLFKYQEHTFKISVTDKTLVGKLFSIFKSNKVKINAKVCCSHNSQRDLQAFLLFYEINPIFNLRELEIQLDNEVDSMIPLDMINSFENLTFVWNGRFQKVQSQSWIETFSSLSTKNTKYVFKNFICDLKGTLMPQKLSEVQFEGYSACCTDLMELLKEKITKVQF